MIDLHRLHPDDLRVGGCYLHNNGDFVRNIDSIDGDTIGWHDQYGPGVCSKKAFLKVCHSVVPDGSGAETRSEQTSKTEAFTLRDEANALTAYAFRNGFLEDLHAGKSSPLLDDSSLNRITDEEMKRLMIDASEKLAEMLQLKQDARAAYEVWLRSYHWRFCRKWKSD